MYTISDPDLDLTWRVICVNCPRPVLSSSSALHHSYTGAWPLSPRLGWTRELFYFELGLLCIYTFVRILWTAFKCVYRVINELFIFSMVSDKQLQLFGKGKYIIRVIRG